MAGCLAIGHDFFGGRASPLAALVATVGGGTWLTCPDVLGNDPSTESLDFRG